MPVIREDMPSSGQSPCDHVWQVLEGAGSPAGTMTLVCRKCTATKIVEKPAVKESQGQKPVLFG